MSIYSISNWSAGTYNLWDIVRYPSNTSNFYYSLTDGNTDTPSPSNANWGGISSFNGKTIPKFVWRTNYGTVKEHEPMTLEVKFEGGYSQRLIQNIHNDLLTLQVSFDLRTEKEAQAIIHFLYARKAQESFLFTPSPPHDLEKLFICKNWNDTYNYYNNHSINAVFEETTNQSR